MDERQNSNRPVNPRRRKRSPLQTFKEAYLPVIIAAAAVVLIIVFIVGSVSRSNALKKQQEEESIAASIQEATEAARLEAEAKRRLAQAANLAADYDYDGAIDVLQSFSGDIMDYPELNDQILVYEQARDSMVAWDDPSKITNLSFQLLVADTERAYNHGVYASAFRNNFVTTYEFSKMLEQLYANGYMLVSTSDFLTTTTALDGSQVYTAKTLYLPAGKKPLVLTQTNVNYNIYLVDSDGDSLPDKNGCGFASKLILDAQGNLTCEMVDSSGNTVTGAYDLVPILEEFVQLHPDFSYKGAKAVLAVTGYNGLFGYRTHPAAKNTFGVAAYEAEVEGARKIAKALRDSGYEFACYSYENVSYKECSISQIKSDLQKWLNEVPSILGEVDIYVMAQNEDISSNKDAYSGDKFNILSDGGFNLFMGFSTDGAPWATVSGNHVRLGRIMVTGKNLKNNSGWFTDLFDAQSVLDPTRS